MTQEEQAHEVEKIYNEAIAKLELLVEERAILVEEYKDVVRGFIKDLELKKVSAVRQSLGLTDKE